MSVAVLEREANLVEILNSASAVLAATSKTPRLDAEILLAHALGMEREALLLLDPSDFQARFAVSKSKLAFASYLDRRRECEPIAYIVGYRDFWTLRLAVGKGVLIPRPDSETLIEAAIDSWESRSTAPRSILDLGTGSGALLLAALDHWKSAHGVGVDISPTALGYAKRNAETLGFAERTHWLEGDWRASNPLSSASLAIPSHFDIILCNPPYIACGTVLSRDSLEYEPQIALYAGVDEGDAMRHIVPKLSTMLAPTGLVILEIGCGQAGDVSRLVRQYGFDMRIRHDINGHARAAIVSLA